MNLGASAYAYWPSGCFFGEMSLRRICLLFLSASFLFYWVLVGVLVDSVAPEHVGSQSPDQGPNLCLLRWKEDS